MKVLVFLGEGAENRTIESIVRELIKRHDVKLAALSKNNQQITMSEEFSDRMIPSDTCINQYVDWADCIFTTDKSPVYALDFEKYIFSFQSMLHCFDRSCGYDFVFTQEDISNVELLSYCASMPVGLTVVEGSAATEQKKQILYVDDCWFPFGKEGKRQIAQMLLDICRNFPDYTLCIRPAWFPEKNDCATPLPNFTHIYHELECLSPDGLPANLELLQEERDLWQLIGESSCILSLAGSMSYLQAARCSKPQLIIGGVACEDSCHMRSSWLARINQFTQKSGCIVDFREAISFLPEGKMCDPEHLRQVYPYTKGTAERVINTMEYIFEEFLSKGLYPDIKQYHYETFFKEMSSESHLRMEELQSNRRFGFMAHSYGLAADINWRPYYQEINCLCRLSVDADGKISALKSFSTLEKTAYKIRCKYLIENAHQLRTDVDEAYLYFALYQQKKYSKLMELYQSTEEHHESLEYYVGSLYWNFGQEAVAAECLKRFLLGSMSRDFEKYVTDAWQDRVQAFGKVLNRLMKQDENNELEQFVDMFLTFVRRYPGRKYLSRNFLEHLHFHLLEKGLEPQAQELASLLKALEEDEKVILDRKAWENPIKRAAKGILKKIQSLGKASIKKTKKILKACRKGIWKALGKLKKRMRRYKMLRPLGKRWYDVRRVLHYYSPQEKDVLSFKDKHLGEACFVIGNGPSLTAQDLERIQAKGYTCFASNKIYKIYDQTHWRPDYFACIDREVFYQNLYEIVSTTQCPMFLHRDFTTAVKNYEKTIGGSVGNAHYMRYYCKDSKETFYPQAANIISGGTVTFTLLELAWMLGFRKIYIIGCDNTYSSFQNIDSSSEVITSNENTSNDYFAKNYMRPGEIMRVGDLDKATRGYASARQFIESHGGEIYNATRGGHLEVFKRVDLDELLEQPYVLGSEKEGEL